MLAHHVCAKERAGDICRLFAVNSVEWISICGL